MRRRLAAALAAAILAAAGGAAASSDILSLYGGENRGTSGAQFLRLPVGARAVALGQAYTASATDGCALFWNPAGVLRTPARHNLFLAHTLYAADIGLDYASWHWRGQNFGYGLTAGMLRSGDIPRTTELHQQGTGQTFRADQYFIGVTLARAMTDRFSMGGTVKFYQENLDEFTARSVLMDLGILYFVGYGDLRVGFAVHNFGPDIRPGGTPPELPAGYEQVAEFQSFPAPTSGAFGVANTVQLAQQLSLMLAADFNHPSDYSESFRFGGELGWDQRFFVRSGFETNRDAGGFAAGFGVQAGTEGFDLRFDYAVRDMGNFGTMHYLSVDLSPLFGRMPR